jgi:lysine/ornithine N-monooxygenase
VTEVTYGPLHVLDHDIVDGFHVTVRSAEGRLESFGARAVVFAVGPSSKICIPPAIAAALPDELAVPKDPELPWARTAVQGEAWCHSAAFAMKDFSFLNEQVRDKIASGESTTVVVIGGGLTSAQIVDLCVVSGVTRVILVCRSRIKVKHCE